MQCKMCERNECGSRMTCSKCGKELCEWTDKGCVIRPHYQRQDTSICIDCYASGKKFEG